MKTPQKWICIDRLKPPSDMRVLGCGKSGFNGKKRTLAVGFIINENGVWRLIDEANGIEGLYDVEHWQHIKLPK